MNYSFLSQAARRAEERIPAMGYGEMLENLGRLTELSVLAPENPISMLVVARLVDRTRILNSGIGSKQIHSALNRYRNGRRWRPVEGVIKALEQALETALANERLESAHTAGQGVR